MQTLFQPFALRHLTLLSRRRQSRETLMSWHERACLKFDATVARSHCVISQGASGALEGKSGERRACVCLSRKMTVLLYGRFREWSSRCTHSTVTRVIPPYRRPTLSSLVTEIGFSEDAAVPSRLAVGQSASPKLLARSE